MKKTLQIGCAKRKPGKKFMTFIQGKIRLSKGVRTGGCKIKDHVLVHLRISSGWISSECMTYTDGDDPPGRLIMVFGLASLY